MNGPSKHLTWKELECKDGTPYPKAFIDDGTVELLAFAFEGIRALFGKPIKVVSAYRTKSWNTKIGGAKKSQHMFGRALDLKPPRGVSVGQFYETIKEFAPFVGITGIGRYPTFVHIDIRPVDRLVTWYATGQKDNV